MASAVGTPGPGSPFSQIPVSCPKQVLFVGDSFVTRFSRYCTRETIINCGIQRDLVNFSTLGAGGAGISFVREGAPQSAAVRADFLILQIGGNDLNHLQCDPVQHARQILSLARNFIAHKNVKHVAICQLCYRVMPSGQKLGLPSRHPLRAHYNALVDQVNAELKRLIAFFPKCVYWKHRGMLSDYISLLSDDGVHIAAAGERLYYRSIRGAALYLSKRV